MNTIKCPWCGCNMEFIDHDGGECYNKDCGVWACSDCTHIKVLDWRE